MNEHRDHAYEIIAHAEETDKRGYRVNNYSEVVIGAILLQLAGLRDDLAALKQQDVPVKAQVM